MYVCVICLDFVDLNDDCTCMRNKLIRLLNAILADKSEKQRRGFFRMKDLRLIPGNIFIRKADKFVQEHSCNLLSYLQQRNICILLANFFISSGFICHRIQGSELAIKNKYNDMIKKDTRGNTLSISYKTKWEKLHFKTGRIR